jgi:cathepsin X
MALLALTLLTALGQAAAARTPWQARLTLLQRVSWSDDEAPLRARGPPLPPFDRVGAARHNTAALPAEVVASPRPEDYLADSAIPAGWDWRSIQVAVGAPSVHFTTRIRNQFLPLWCGSCWAHAATAVLGSRWLISNADQPAPTNATFAGIDFSVQYFIDCVNGSRGCHGGSAYEAFHLAHEFGTVDSSCIPYSAYNKNCTAHNTCEQNLDGRHPKILSVDPIRYFVGEFGVVGAKMASVEEKESAMMKEIFARGPIASCMACPEEFEEYTGGIFATTNNRTVCDHIVAIIGFGGEGTSAHWVVQNSFGSVWGEVSQRFQWSMTPSPPPKIRSV